MKIDGRLHNPDGIGKMRKAVLQYGYVSALTPA
jgi:hypothetical protein